jgi:hypothetical protein
MVSFIMHLKVIIIISELVSHINLKLDSPKDNEVFKPNSFTRKGTFSKL